MTAFHAGRGIVWKKIRGRTGKTTTITAAIAYLSKANIIPFKKGDMLVTDLSLQSVRAGISNPKAAIALAKKGVDIRCHPNLHAKVILVGNRLFVGSMNASAGSANELVEGAIETADKRAHSNAGKWLRQLRSELPRLTILVLEKLALEYQPPSRKRKKLRKAPKTSDDYREARTWLCHTTLDEEGSEDADQILEDGPEDERIADYSTEWYSCWRSRHGNIRLGDFIIMTCEQAGHTDVWPPSEVWEHRIIDGRRYLFVAHARGDVNREIPWRTFKQLAYRHGATKLALKRDRQIPIATATLIEENWPRKHIERRRKIT